jgi:hypothetical protein
MVRFRTIQLLVVEIIINSVVIAIAVGTCTCRMMAHAISVMHAVNPFSIVVVVAVTADRHEFYSPKIL